jgi:hypothetical protein
LKISSPKKNQANVPERGRLARKRVCALKSVVPEINLEFNLNAIFRALALMRASRPRSDI